MSSLTGSTPSNTYKQLLQIGSSNVGLTGSIQYVQDGDGNNTILGLSTGSVNINGTFTVNGSSIVQTITLTGDVTGSGTGSFAATIGDGKVTTAKLAASAVTYAKIQNVANNKLLGNASGSAAAPLEIGVNSPLTFTGGNLALTGTPIVSVKTQRFTSTGAFTYTPSAGMVYCIIELQAGGGSGAGAQATANPNSCGGNGGGGGGYLRIYATAANIGASAAGSVGAGGTAATSGNNAGNAGGNTTITINGTTWTAAGGKGGNTTANSSAVKPGTNNATPATNTSGATGTLLLDIGPSWGNVAWCAGSTIFSLAGCGGNSFLGHGGSGSGATPATATTGTAGSGYGWGSSGGAATSNGGTFTSTNVAGGNGIAIVTEFCTQ